MKSCPTVPMSSNGSVIIFSLQEVGTDCIELCRAATHRNLSVIECQRINASFAKCENQGKHDGSKMHENSKN